MAPAIPVGSLPAADLRSSYAVRPPAGLESLETLRHPASARLESLETPRHPVSAGLETLETSRHLVSGR